jgi:4-hydroxybenzoate polyprenyltransferase
MKYLFAFFRLIRWPNLGFIILCQWLFFYVVVRSLFVEEIFFYRAFSPFLFYQLMGASVLIAAAGYVINDYFDINIDHINKPEKVLVGKIFKRRQAIFLHLLMSAAGFAMSLNVSLKLGNHAIWMGNLICIVALWFYSAVFKKKALSGNIIVSVLTAWVIGILYFFAGGKFLSPDAFVPVSSMPDMRKLFFYCLLYSAFAFIISLIREVVKDMEDAIGDEAQGCSTIPLQWGFPAAKVFCLTWMAVLLISLLLLVIYGIQSGWYWRSAYLTLFVSFPLLREIWKMNRAVVTEDYSRISRNLKWIMLSGILSMLLTSMDS